MAATPGVVLQTLTERFIRNVKALRDEEVVAAERKPPVYKRCRALHRRRGSPVDLRKSLKERRSRARNAEFERRRNIQLPTDIFGNALNLCEETEDGQIVEEDDDYQRHFLTGFVRPRPPHTGDPEYISLIDASDNDSSDTVVLNSEQMARLEFAVKDYIKKMKKPTSSADTLIQSRDSNTSFPEVTVLGDADSSQSNGNASSEEDAVQSDRYASRSDRDVSQTPSLDETPSMDETYNFLSEDARLDENGNIMASPMKSFLMGETLKPLEGTGEATLPQSGMSMHELLCQVRRGLTNDMHSSIETVKCLKDLNVILKTCCPSLTNFVLTFIHKNIKLLSRSLGSSLETEVVQACLVFCITVYRFDEVLPPGLMHTLASSIFEESTNSSFMYGWPFSCLCFIFETSRNVWLLDFTVDNCSKFNYILVRYALLYIENILRHNNLLDIVTCAKKIKAILTEVNARCPTRFKEQLQNISAILANTENQSRASGGILG